MRIALVSQEYPPETAKGGIGSQTRTKALGLAALGHEVIVLSRTAPKAQRSERQDGAARVIRIPGLEQRMGVFTEAADWLSYSVEVAAAISDIHASTPLDLVDFPEWGAEGFAHLLNRSEWNHIPAVVHLHGPLVMFAHSIGWPDTDSEFYRAGTHMEGTCVRLADAVFSSSRCSAEWCARHYGINVSKVPVIHTGVDTRVFADRGGTKADRPTVVFAGKLTRNKGVHLLVEAGCRLAAEFPGLRLELLGRGEGQIIGELRNLTQRHGTPDLLDLPGFVSPEEMAARFSRAHAFAAPSQYEGGPGFVYLEAMACGLPAIACSGSGAAEVVRDGKTGFLVPAQEIEPLVGALRALLSNEELRRDMGALAAEYVRAEADSRVCIRRLEAFYRAVVEGGKNWGACLHAPKNAVERQARPAASSLETVRTS